MNSSAAATKATRNGTLNGCDQNAPVDTFTAQASTIAPITAQAANGVSTPRSRPIPPRVSAAVTMKAANPGRRQPLDSMNPTAVPKSKALIRPACSMVAPTAIRRISSPVSVIPVVGSASMVLVMPD